MIETREYAFSKPEYRRFLRRLSIERHARPFVIGCFLVATIAVSQCSNDLSSGVWSVLVDWAPVMLIFVIWALWALVFTPVRLSNAPSATSDYLEQKLVFGLDTLNVEVADGSRYEIPYASITRMDRLEEFILIRQDSGAINGVPLRAFSDYDAAEAAVGLFERAEKKPVLEETPSGEPSQMQTGLLSGLRQNLSAGLRLIMFKTVDRNAFSINSDQLIVLSLVVLLITIVGQYFAINGDVDFSAYGFQTDATTLLLLLLAVYLVGRVLGCPSCFLPFAVMVLSIDPWITAFQSTAQIIGAVNAELYFVMAYVQFGAFVWYVLIWVRVAGAIFRPRIRGVAVSLLLLFVAVVMPTTVLPVNEFWYERFDEPEFPDINVENVFYQQVGMVSDAVSTLKEQRAGVIDLYHVGFGSYASQSVFRREIGHVKQVLDERFDTAGRSLSLVNHIDSVSDTPIASASNLSMALKGVAGKMDVDEDVLFLYLTSHGSQDGELSVSFWPLPLNTLAAQGLRDMLDESGIRWRVVIVSACYSGTFINALKDKNTLVITAAAHDRNSFGCSNENEYTYFGEAYFKHALQKTSSFIEAYSLAKEMVAERERIERLQPSHPSIEVGEKIRGHLAELERRLVRADRSLVGFADQ